MDLLNIQPHKVSKDLKGYIITFYGEPKSGKTSTAVQFPNHLLLAFEKGYNTIPGAMAMPMNKWSDLIIALRQLATQEVKDKFSNIIVDTADIAYELCEKHILSREGVQNIKDIPFGAGYGMVEKEFDTRMREISQLGYGLILISHSTDKTFTDETGQEYNRIVTTLDKRANKIVTRMSDIIGYSRSVPAENGGEEVRLFMRGTNRFMAGSRFRDVPEIGYEFPTSIVFNYTNLVNTISEAVEALEKQYGASAVTDEVSNLNVVEEDKREVEDIVQEFNDLAGRLMTVDSDYYGPRIVGIVEEVLGAGAKISEVTPAQADLAELALVQLKDIATK